MKRFLILILLVSLTSASIQPGHCSCRKATAQNTTHWGWIVNKTIKGGSVKALKGRVVNRDGQLLANALVEVFDKPEVWLADKGYQNRDKQKRLAACLTREKGEFCFTGLRPGRYELRGSSPEPYDPMHVIVTLAPNNQQSKKGDIRIALEVSQ